MINNITRFSFVFALAVLVTIAPDFALALDAQIGGGLCNIVGDMTGTVGQGIATLGVLFLGIGAFFGKVNWGLAVTIGAGIAALFGAAAIVGTVGGSASGC